MRRVVLASLVAIATVQVAYSQEAGSDQAFLQYEMRKVDPWGPFVLNLLLPFGLGSHVQGDTTGGMVVTVGHLAGALGILLAYGTGLDPSGAVGTAAIGVSVAASLVGLVLPFTYANAANEKLRQDLGLSVSGISWAERGITLTLATKLE